jgi:hypothetical protein
MENELAYYVGLGVGGGDSVNDKRHEFYRNGREPGLSTDDYRRLYFLDLLGADFDDPRSTQDLEAAWFGEQGFDRSSGFAAAYVGEASLGGNPATPTFDAGAVYFDPTPVSATVTLLDPATNNLTAGDFLALAIRSQNGVVDDEFSVPGEHVSINNPAGTRHLAFVAPIDPFVPVDPATAPGTITVTRTSDTSSRTLYAPLYLRDVDLGSVDYAMAANTGPTDWSGPVTAIKDNTLLVLILGWEMTATNTPVYGPTAGVMVDAELVASGSSSEDTGISRTGISVYAKVVEKGEYLMTNSDIGIVSGTGTGTSVSAQLVAIGPKVIAEPKVAAWLGKSKTNRLMAHRGGSVPFPEHSDYAYQNAVGIGFICLEISSQRTSDGVWIANHDRYLDRTALGTETTTLDITAMTLAEVQEYDISFANGRVPQPIALLEDLIDKYKNRAVFMVDPKNSTAHLSEFLDILDEKGGPTKFICKFSGPGAVNTHRATCQARGYKVWGYYYGDEDFTGAEQYDILGLNNSADQSAWDELKETGRLVLGHVIQNSTQYDEALAKGADGFQIAATTTIYPE